MKIEAYFDGACGPVNPGGHAGWGALIFVDGVDIWSSHGYTGHGPLMSNNVAEYCGLISVLDHIRRQQWLFDLVAKNGALIKGDSNLVIMQMKGIWKAKNGLYKKYYHQAVDAKFKFPLGSLSFEWIPRDKNWRADELSKLATANRVGVS